MGKNKEEVKAVSKKEAVTSGGKSGKGKLTGIAAAIAVAVIVGAVVFSGDGTPFKTISAEAGTISIPINDVSDGKAHFYTFNGSKKINFFVLKSSDGAVRAAFDACDVCFREKKGYRQEGDLMVCNNCGQAFPSVKINEVRGGCNPAPVERYSDGRTLRINVSDIEQGRMYF